VRATILLFAIVIGVVCGACERDQVPTGWKKAPVECFTLYVPPDLERDYGLLPIDSEAGVLKSPGLWISFDCGSYSGCYPDSGQRIKMHGASRATLWLDHPTMDSDSLKPYVVSLCATSSRDLDRATRLSLIAHCATEGKRNLAIAILRTARFDTRK
jgi:hypothetical protein